MATPVPELHAREAVLSTTVDSSQPSISGCLDGSDEQSPILIFLFFHKSVLNELEALHGLAMKFATGRSVDINALRERYSFLRSIYKHHCNAEDEVIFPALDIRVKNVAPAYSMEHEHENNLFDHLFELLTSSVQSDESLRRELASCTGALQTSISQHMAKEQEQVLPLLAEKFLHQEQAYLVWQFLCSIPVNILEELLRWLAASISSHEYEDLQKCLGKIVPEEKLLKQIIFSWMEKKTGARAFPCSMDGSQTRCVFGFDNSMSTLQTGAVRCVCETMKVGKRKYEELGNHEDDRVLYPIDEILLWHRAIAKELNELAEKAKKIQNFGKFSDLSAFDEQLQFLAEVCIFHSIAEDKVIFPAVGGELSFSQEHDEEVSQFNEFRCLIENIQRVGAASTSASQFYSKLSSHADLIIQTIQRHFHNEEAQVLPLARKHFSLKRQQELLYQSLCVMPLRLIERVLPWLVGSLAEDEAIDFLKNLHCGAPATDTALVTLLSGWACKGRSSGLCLSVNGAIFCPAKKFGDIEENCIKSCGAYCSTSCFRNSLASDNENQRKRRVGQNFSRERVDASCSSVISDSMQQSGNVRACRVPALGVNINNPGFSSLTAVKSLRSSSLSPTVPSLSSSLFIWATDAGDSNIGSEERPIDTIFKFHKAISKDLEYLDVESGKLIDCDDNFLRQFIGRFRLLWGFYRAHSNAEDEIVFPALESKETLHNVSHSYTLDHKQEEKLFEEISFVLTELSMLHGKVHNFQAAEIDCDLTDADGKNYRKKYNEEAMKLQGMCKSIRFALDQHIFLEERQLWPLFDKHFTVMEQDKIVGQIIGTTGAEVLQSMLPWVTSALTQDEQSKMLDIWKQATKNTMFDEWLNECWKGQSEASSQKGAEKSNVLRRDVGIPEQNDLMFKPGWKDIFRMNQNELEAEIRKVYGDSTLDPRRKAYLVQNLMTSRWIAAQQKLPKTVADSSNGDREFSPSFRDSEKQVFGCEHYKRNCKLRAACCGQLFTCRFCHDKVSDHTMDRKATHEMMCMQCLKIQPVGPVCATPSCNGFPMAMYYCNICKLFDDERTVYHCPFCNLCRVGKGLGIDYFHCMTCNCCLAMKLVNHVCLEKSLETNCPICCEFLFTSSEAVRALPCGHYMHSACFQAYTCSHYTCPICGKSLGDMAVYFGMLDALLATEDLPEEYKSRCQEILCNDCGRKGVSRFHWLYHKCGICGSYNTRVIKPETAAPNCSNVH